MSSRLYVGNLPYSVNDDQLRDHFSKAGNVVSAKVITDKYSGRSKGFAFVEFEDQKEGDKAIEMFNETEMEGRKLIVNVARPREERSTSGNAGGFSNRNSEQDFQNVKN